MYSKLANPANYQEIKRKESDIKYIVVHYTGNNGDTARNNLDYFHENKVEASAHFFVDDTEICCSVPWCFRAWHCGAKKYIHNDCRNANSIGIELCSRKTENGLYYFTDSVMDRAAQFIAQQMKNYNLSIDRVVRHYDVTGKLCPRPFIDEVAWNEFKEKILAYHSGKVGDTVKIYNKITEIPAGEKRAVVQKLIERKIIRGTTDGNLNLSDDMVRLLVFNNRAGLYN